MSTETRDNTHPVPHQHVVLVEAALDTCINALCAGTLVKPRGEADGTNNLVKCHVMML